MKRVISLLVVLFAMAASVANAQVMRNVVLDVSYQDVGNDAGAAGVPLGVQVGPPTRLPSAGRIDGMLVIGAFGTPAMDDATTDYPVTDANGKLDHYQVFGHRVTATASTVVHDAIQLETGAIFGRVTDSKGGTSAPLLEHAIAKITLPIGSRYVWITHGWVLDGTTPRATTFVASAYRDSDQ